MTINFNSKINRPNLNYLYRSDQIISFISTEQNAWDPEISINEKFEKFLFFSVFFKALK